MDLLSIVVILLIAFWLIGLIFRIGGKLVHILLVIGLVVLVARLLGIGG
jgi:hypothetical protein